MGVILKDKLEDFDAAGDEFNRLLSDYPDNVYRLDTYYNLYLMYMRMGDALSAEKYRDLILSDFPESSYGMALRDPKYLDNLRDMDRVQQELYDRTYQAYLENRNAEVHRGYEEMESRYPLSKIMPKFMFLHALALVTEKKTEDFNAVLRQLRALPRHGYHTYSIGLAQRHGTRPRASDSPIGEPARHDMGHATDKRHNRHCRRTRSRCIRPQSGYPPVAGIHIRNRRDTDKSAALRNRTP